jgi:hypothetical protein
MLKPLHRPHKFHSHQALIWLLFYQKLIQMFHRQFQLLWLSLIYRLRFVCFFLILTP